MKIIDLSTTIEPGPDIEISYMAHSEGAETIRNMFNVPDHLLKNNEGWAVETINRLSTHGCTHIDAPWHYNSRVAGEKAQTIDQLPLEWFWGDGVVFEMRHKVDNDPVSVADCREELARIGYSLKPLDIVLIRNGRDEFYGRSDYMFRGCGVSAEATRWLYEQGVRVMGIDCWGWDSPLDRQAREANERSEAGIFWAAHQADIPYCQIERLVNLAPLPSFGFKVACFPLKIKNGSAGPARVVALFD